jgi:hypothetical protein
VSDNSIDMLMVVAKVLDRLPQPVVYNGDATIPLYLDALSARDMRSTDDVDCVVEVTKIIKIDFSSTGMSSWSSLSTGVSSERGNSSAVGRYLICSDWNMTTSPKDI